MHVHAAAPRATYLVVVARGRLLIGRPQGLKLRIQDVQELLDQPDGHADITGVDSASRQVDQLAGDVGCVLAALDLETNTSLFVVFFLFFKIDSAP